MYNFDTQELIRQAWDDMAHSGPQNNKQNPSLHCLSGLLLLVSRDQDLGQQDSGRTEKAEWKENCLCIFKPENLIAEAPKTYIYDKKKLWRSSALSSSR